MKTRSLLLLLSLATCPVIASDHPLQVDKTDSQCPLPEEAGLVTSGKINPDCALPVKNIANINSYVVIDTRSAEEFQRYFVQNSLNMDARFIDTQSQFKNKDILLINSGFKRHETQVLCQQLKQQGFTKVKFLDGGINALETGNYPLVYTSDYVFQAPQVTIEAFIEELTDGKVTTLTLDENYQKFFNANKMEASWIKTTSQNWAIVRKAIEPYVEAAKGGPIVLSGDPESLAILEKQFRVDPMPNLYFFYEADLKLQKYVLNNYLMNLAKIKEIKNKKCEG